MFKKKYKNNFAYRFTTKFLLLVSSFAAVLAVTEARSEGQIFKHRLSNGLEIVVKPDHRSPVAAVMVWYRAGSIDEVGGTTGIAHLLEHMMFQGTETLAPGEHAKKLQRREDDRTRLHQPTTPATCRRFIVLSLSLRFNWRRIACAIYYYRTRNSTMSFGW